MRRMIRDSALESAKEEAQENYDRFLRLSAEFENYKKRTAREMDDFRKYANETMIMELLDGRGQSGTGDRISRQR